MPNHVHSQSNQKYVHVFWKVWGTQPGNIALYQPKRAGSNWVKLEHVLLRMYGGVVRSTGGSALDLGAREK